MTLDLSTLTDFGRGAHVGHADYCAAGLGGQAAQDAPPCNFRGTSRNQAARPTMEKRIMAELFEQRIARIMLVSEGAATGELSMADVACQAELSAFGLDDPRPYARATWRIADGASSIGDGALVEKTEKSLPAPALRAAKTIACLYRRGMRGADIATLEAELAATKDFPALRELGLTAAEIALVAAIADPSNAVNPDVGARERAKLGARIGGPAMDIATAAVLRRDWAINRLRELQTISKSDLTPAEQSAAKTEQAMREAKSVTAYLAATEAERQKMIDAKRLVAEAEKKLEAQRTMHSRAAAGLLT